LIRGVTNLRSKQLEKSPIFPVHQGIYVAKTQFSLYFSNLRRRCACGFSRAADAATAAASRDLRRRRAVGPCEKCGLGWFVLGRFQRIVTPPEQHQFLELFENYVVATYSGRLSEHLAVGGEPSEP
jgi:hypothetical protein